MPSETVEDLGDWLGEQREKGEIVVGLENNLTPEETKKKVMLRHGESAALFFETISQATAENEVASARDDGTEERRVEKNSDVFSLDPNVILILGEEVEGIPAEIREECDYFLEIPMRGKKESFNVSVAAGIAMWGLVG